MKKSVLKYIVLVLTVALLCLAFTACNNDATTPSPAAVSEYEVNAGLLSDEFVDYAQTVKLNTETYPQLADMGLTLVTEYLSDTEVVEVDADGVDEETGKTNMELYFDAARPSIILIHGVQFDGGRRGRVHMWTENRDEEVNSSNYDVEKEIEYLKSTAAFNEDHNMSKYWFDGGNGRQAYNVFYFHYERFSDMVGAGEGALVSDAAYPGIVVNNIWSTSNGVQAICEKPETVDLPRDQKEYFMTEEGQALGGYSVAELYAAEYIRAFGQISALYPNYDKYTYVASHSMGGVVSVAGNMLLKLLADDGQIAMGLTPNRIIQMDSFVGMPGVDYESTINWSGKKYLANGENTQSACQNYLYSMEALALKYDVAVDFYMNKGVGVPFTCMAYWNNQTSQFSGYRQEEANRILAVSTMVTLSPYFVGVTDALFGDGHNAIREWVLSSYLYDAPKATDAEGNEFTVPTALMANADVIALRGTYFEMIGRDSDGNFVTKNSKGVYPDGTLGVETMRCDDDAFNKLI